MNRHDAIDALEKFHGDTDEEIAHFEGDKVLCQFLASLGYQDVVDAWEKIDKWYA